MYLKITLTPCNKGVIIYFLRIIHLASNLISRFEAAVAEWLSSWLAEQEVWFRFPASPLEFQRLVISRFQVAIRLQYHYKHDKAM